VGGQNSTSSQHDQISPWHLAAEDYLSAGYMPFPLPLGRKSPPPKNVTGGIEHNFEQHTQLVAGWLQDDEPRNIGIVIPSNMVVLDVDGAEAEKRLTDYLGDIPTTWASSSGRENRYHLWYQTPNDRTWPGKIVAGVDVLQHHHRYLVVPPSVHPSGKLYRFLSPRKSVAWHIPTLEELNIVSNRLLRETRRGKFVPYERAQLDTRLWLTEHGKGKLCPELRRVVSQHQRLLRKHAALGGMHDAMTNGVWAILAEISHGHLGGYQALKRFKETFLEQAAETGRRSGYESKAEWGRACVGAIEKTAIERVRIGDPCLIEEEERDKDPDRFFDGKHGIKAISLQRAVERTGRLEPGPGKAIYRHYDGVWSPDGESEIYRRVQKLLKERARPNHATMVKTFVEHREPFITDEREDTRYLNLPNGLLDWRTGRLEPHNANIVTTIRIPVAWDEDAECPLILDWLRDVFAYDATEFALEVLGYMLYNANPLHKAILLYGTGRNGKSTFLKLATMLAGHNNVSAVTPQAIDDNRFAAAQIHGKLANLAGDVDPRIFKSTERFKQLTGGDWMMVEHKNRDPFTFVCRALMIASFNALPRTADTTDAFFSRWLVLPFPKTFTNPDIHLIHRLAPEIPGLLRMAVERLKNVIERGHFVLPVTVKEATDRFRAEADPLRAFIAERIEWTGLPEFISRNDVYAEYAMWAAQNGFSAMSSMRFYEAVGHTLVPALERPVPASLRHGYQGWRGIRIRK